MPKLSRQIDQAVFRSCFAGELAGETPADNRPRQAPGVCYSYVQPTPVEDPHLLGWAAGLAAFLGLEEPAERAPAVNVLGGNLLPAGMRPFAARYGGHQFGTWAGQLGDGRAISLGEIEASDGTFWEIQLKGAGPTPYSRHADGRAVLRSSLREFVCSEAMHYLGVPTTRALSLVGTGERVIRDMFYDGHPELEKGAIVARVAPSFVRFGNFEIMAAHGEQRNLEALASHVIRRFYPELGEPGENAYLRWFEEICRRTAVLIAHWMTKGFVHGVMNTDNMSILGLTIDYGPYGWLEHFDPDWTPNTTDFRHGRYAFGQQPQVALWNLMMLARALSPLVADPESLRGGLEIYGASLNESLHAMMGAKLGLSVKPGDSGDRPLFDDLYAALGVSRLDMTVFFRELSRALPDLSAGGGRFGEAARAVISAASYEEPLSTGQTELESWLARYTERLRGEERDAEAIRKGMLAVNPKFVPRNYLCQTAIEAADRGDLAPLRRLMRVLERPYDEQPEHGELAGKRPEWARDKPGCSALSCSS